MIMVLQLGFLCALLSFTQLCKAQEQVQLSSDLLTCETDYWLSISCFVDSRAIPNRMENVTYNLEFVLTASKEKKCICSLLVEKDGYRCKFRADFAMYPTFANFHNFTISLCASKQCILLKSNYKPAHHIKPITPYNLTVEYENGIYIFEWKSGYENHRYHSVLPFRSILAYQQVGQPMKKLEISGTTYNISESHFGPGTEYIAKVCTKVGRSESYKGNISHWSTEIRWKTPQRAITAERTVTVICLAVGLMCLLLFPVARMKIKKIRCVKTPVPYIIPLNQTAQGDFQFSLSKDYSEEISTIDMIIEITPKEQLQEHTLDIYPQNHTPYVGPLMEIWVPCLTPDSRITTNKPCNDLDFLHDNCDVKETLLCLNMAQDIEVFLSLDDLEPSLEICKSSETLSSTPNPECFVQNYCTLTNTAIGLIPTFCRVQCDPNLGLGLNGDTSPDLLNMQIEANTPELDTVTLDNMQLSMEE
ncbi:interleukin 21 receptor, tandem duplicate 1 isoform X3 [Neoarius graeffei]|uniref:interleukin 21 receptor, tandem duplicate 1 isoform X3 n=1 Tax=Neoarius graeffei TaxID=443677 RepID=UPI00298C715C|nr:interleukin 21 receptor, tandem duplicate 1 isoform X3 [Neoarius graeffei]